MKLTPTSPAMLGSLLIGAAAISASEGAVVINHIGDLVSYDFNGGVDSSPSQIFTDFPTFDSVVLEDFSVTSDLRQVTRVSVLFHSQGGFDSFDDVEGYSLSIYTDANFAGVSLIGDVANLLVMTGSGAAVSQVIDSSTGNEYGLVTLDVDITLPSAGTYWIGVSPKSSLSASGQFLIPYGGATGSTTPGNSDARLANPGEGFGMGTLTVLDQDYAYSVTSIPEPGFVPLWIVSGAALCLRRNRTRNS
ncbi:hypothetical protein [Haloferula sp.]|uniref:hypothetical protein n=1 Tax=Haloferula sp. TaxID=2497595 RepID=UPI00329AD481